MGPVPLRWDFSGGRADTVLMVVNTHTDPNADDPLKQYFNGPATAKVSLRNLPFPSASRSRVPILLPSRQTTTINLLPLPRSLCLAETFSKPHARSLDHWVTETVTAAGLLLKML
jgi:hypothetical protein